MDPFNWSSYFYPIILVDDAKKNLKYILLLLPSVLFWAWYFILFSNQIGVMDTTLPPFYIFPKIKIFSLIMLFSFGSIGLYFLYKIDKKRFQLIIAYVIIVLVSG